MSLLECLVVVSEKAANIARKCRQEEHLFGLLVEEKKSGEANPRFVQDFKTLADVLIQQTVKHDVGKLLPELSEHIKGEESNIFSNKLRETICVDVQESPEETSNLLEKVLNGDKRAADLLSAEVHRDVHLEDVQTTKPLPDDFVLDISTLGIWIDPIDSTAEYISGRETAGPNNIYLSGLRCVTVLIGVYDRKTGHPVMGVVNQPFHKIEENEWSGCCYWGVCLPEFSSSSVLTAHPQTNIVCLSNSEADGMKEKLKQNSYELAEAAGAGYKMLSVITGSADAYILTKSSTFKWDTCGPQAVLKSLGGDALVYSEAASCNCVPLSYTEEEGRNKIERCCNVGGVLAFRGRKNVERILEIIGED